MSNEDSKPSLEEFSESITGYEEIGIEQAFGKDIGDLTQTKQVRAMAFVYFKREGQTHEEAKDSALSLGAKAVLDLFDLGDNEEVMPDEPVTDSGKDDSLPVSEQPNLLPSS